MVCVRGMALAFLGYVGILFVCSGSVLASPLRRISLDPLDRFKEFDWNLTKAVGSRSKGNVLISPISLKLVLAMLYEGASGTSAKELQEALAIDNTTAHTKKFVNILQSLQASDPGYEIDVGMKLFIDHNAKPKKEFEKKISDAYNATIDKIDFSNTTSAVKIINSWAKSVTRGHIEQLVSEADTKASTVLLLLNAVYFKGLWSNPFPVQNTHDGTFVTDTNSPVMVKYMTSEYLLNYIDAPELKAQIVRLPYMGDKFAMYILLPDNNTTIDEITELVTPRKITNLIEHMYQVPVKITLPKFKFAFASSLAPVLMHLGIRQIFSNGAELHNIAEGSKDLVVSNVIQRALIDVNEQGTTGSVVTAVELVNKFGMRAHEFNVSRPFVFFIEDETTRTVLFVGKVVNPADPGKPIVGAAGIKPQSPPPAEAAAPTTELPTTTNTMTEPQNSTIPVLASVQPIEDRINSFKQDDPFYYFDVQLAQELSEREKGNWVTSPASIKSILGLLLEGSAKETANELSLLLRLPQKLEVARMKLQNFQKKLMRPAEGIEVQIANRIVAKNGLSIKPTFIETANLHYDANVSHADFSQPSIVSNEINSWVKKVTNNVIPSLISPGDVTPNSLLFFLNGVYFKGEWKYGFHPQRTFNACFYTPECKKVPMMSTTGNFKCGEIENLNARILEMPYKNPRYSMVIIVPNYSTNLKRVIWDLPFNPIIPFLDKLVDGQADVVMPKFTVNFDIKLLPILRKFGLNEVFSERADLSGMITTKAKVSSMIHRAKIEVDENGTVAGAASALGVYTLSANNRWKFVVDRPFLFFIRDYETGFLFEGQVIDPSQKQQDIPLTARALPSLRGLKWNK